MPKIMTRYVHRLVNGVRETAAPGDTAPDWVTNTNAFRIEGASAPEETTTPDENAGAGDDATSTADAAADDLDGLKQAELKAIAKELQISTSGSKAEVADRIRAFRAAPATEETAESAEITAKLEQLAGEQGLDLETMTEAERAALLEAEE